MAIDAKCLADISNLIRKTDFQRMETIADVLNHFRGFHRRHKDRRIDVAV